MTNLINTLRIKKALISGELIPKNKTDAYRIQTPVCLIGQERVIFVCSPYGVHCTGVQGFFYVLKMVNISNPLEVEFLELTLWLL
jgi:hypothetical protein